jgi:uncharacterized protein (TIRG00374 family)
LIRRLRAHWTELLGGAIGIAVIAVVFFVVLPRIASYQDVWAAVRGLSWPWWFALAGAAAVNVVTFAPPYMAALPGLPFRSALAVTLTSTASTYIAPGGPAVGVALSFAMLRAWGFSGRPVTIAVTLTTVWNQFVIFGMPPIALGLLTVVGETHPLLQTVALIGVAVFGGIVAAFALAIGNPRVAKQVGDWLAQAASWLLRFVRRGPVGWSGMTFMRFRRDTIGLLRRRWHWLTLSTLAGHLSMYVVLLVALRALGVSGDEVSAVESFAAWSLVRVLGSIPITPGGFGIIELGLTGALLAFGGNQAEVVAAVLVYRFLTVAPPLVLGAFAGATWRRHHPGWQAQPQET